MNEYNINGYNVQIACFFAEITDPTKTINLIHDLSYKCDDGDFTIQLINCKGLAGIKHLLQSISQSIKAFERGENIANDLGLEICVRASFQRQISKALNILGIEKGKQMVCAVIINGPKGMMHEIGELLGVKDESTFSVNVHVLKKIYGISDEEITAAGGIERLMIERTALLCLEI